MRPAAASTMADGEAAATDEAAVAEVAPATTGPAAAVATAEPDQQPATPIGTGVAAGSSMGPATQAVVDISEMSSFHVDGRVSLDGVDLKTGNEDGTVPHALRFVLCCSICAVVLKLGSAGLGV